MREEKEMEGHAKGRASEPAPAPGVGRARGEREADERVDVKSQVARTLIEAMERGDTPWQKPWSAQSLRPVNAATQNGYRGANRLLLALAGRSTNLWMTYKQAAEKGWQVRKGEKGTMIVKVVEFDRDAGDAKEQGDASGEGGEERRGKGVALRRYWVFNADQVDGMPAIEEPAREPFEPIARAESVMEALKERTGLSIAHGGSEAFYSPEHDRIQLPPREAFSDAYSYFSTALHEGAHSTLHAKRMARAEAIAKKWGDAAYALEELRAEICSALVYAELAAGDAGLRMKQTQAHIDNHAAYLKSWIKAISNDPMAIFSAAKDAEKMAEYMLALERDYSSAKGNEEWLADYDKAWDAERAMAELARR